jgi:hypothetical protein
MSKIILTADDGEKLTGTLPDSWAEVPLVPYAALASAEGLPARIEAAAALVGLPAAPLLEDVDLFAAICRAAPWLFGDELPEATGAVPSFKHAGATYEHVGHLDKITAEQMEALLNFLRESEGKPLQAAPGLLAVLYRPKGKTQTAEVVEASRLAFATLPVSVAWPALADFMRSSASAALNIRTASALNEQARVTLAALEKTLTMAGASSTFWQKAQRSLFRRWLRNARKMLSIS